MKSLYCVHMQSRDCKFATFLVSVDEQPSPIAERKEARAIAERECHSDFSYFATEFICATPESVCTEV